MWVIWYCACVWPKFSFTSDGQLRGPSAFVAADARTDHDLPAKTEVLTRFANKSILESDAISFYTWPDSRVRH